MHKNHFTFDAKKHAMQMMHYKYIYKLKKVKTLNKNLAELLNKMQLL